MGKRSFAMVVSAAVLLTMAAAPPALAGAKRRRAKAAKSDRISDRLPFVSGGSAGASGAKAKKGKRGGVGMVLDGRAGKVVIARVIAGGPAARAGVLAGDQLIAVDGWQIPTKTPTGKVALRVRGRVGTSMSLTVRRKGVAAPVGLTIKRGSMAALFPQLSRKVVAVTPATALIANAGDRTLGIRFVEAGDHKAPVAYEWALTRLGARLGGTGTERGRGLVRWTRRGATIQIDTWRVELAPWPERASLLVRASTLPVALVAARDWLQTEPGKLSYVRPRNAPQPHRRTWATGPCHVRVQASLDGRPAANRRLTLWLADDGGRGMPTASTATDAQGMTSLRLPAGRFRVTNLHASVNGGAGFLYFSRTFAGNTPQVQCKPGGGHVNLELRLSKARKPPRPVALSLPDSATEHKLIGRSLPPLRVRKWFGDQRKLPARLKGKAMLMYVWATWCGPCKRVSPVVAELHARLADKGVLVVSASVDRDGVALADYAAGQLDTAAPIAWLGPTAMGELSISGIPTIFAVDHKGVVRAVHTGTGVGLKAWEAVLAELLKGAGR